MRRTPGALAFRPLGRACAVPLITGMLLATPGLAAAQPGSPDTIGALVAAVADAEASQQTAVSAPTQAQQTFGSQQAELDRLTAERAAARANLDASRNWSAPAGGQPAAQPAAAATGDAAANWDRAPAARE